MAVDVSGALTRKVGPLPAWAYGAVVLVAVYAYRWWQGNQGGSNASANEIADDIGLGSSSADLSGHLGSTGLDGTSGVGSGTGGTAVTPITKPATNAQWIQFGLDYLTDSYGYDRDEIGDALWAKIKGQNLTVKQSVMVTLVNGRYGPPPEGTAPVPAPTDPAKPDPATPAAPKPTTAKPGAPHIHHLVASRTSISVQWNAASHATSYAVYTTGGKRIASGIKGLSYSHGGLKPGTTHWYSVRAYNGSVAGPLSNVLAQTTKR